MRRNMANGAGHLVRIVDVMMRRLKTVQAEKAQYRNEEEQFSHPFILLPNLSRVKGLDGMTRGY